MAAPHYSSEQVSHAQKAEPCSGRGFNSTPSPLLHINPFSTAVNKGIQKIYIYIILNLVTYNLLLTKL